MSSFCKEPFIKLDESQPTFTFYVPKPSAYGNSATSIVIISTSSYENNCIPGIYEFNVYTNKMSLIYKYDKNILVKWHGQFIINDNLYLYGCIDGLTGSYSFNLKTKIIMQLNNDSYIFCESAFPISNYIPSPINQIHIIDINEHFIHKIDDNNNISLLNSQNLDYLQTRFPKSIFIPFKKQIMSFGGINSDNIFCYNINENINENDKLKKWKKYSLTMPYSDLCNTWKYDIFLSFDTLLFIFYFIKREIWCLDLQNGILCQSKDNMPAVIGPDNCKILPIKDKDNNIHIINFESGVHYKVLLTELIPDRIEKYVSKQHNSLIMGYIRQLEKDITIPTIPFVLKHLIWRYFPSFI